LVVIERRKKMTLADWILGAVVVLLWNGFLLWKMRKETKDDTSKGIN